MDKYKKVNSIGQGNFGSVNLHQRISDQKLFAIKKTCFIQQNENYSPLNEIKILESLDHPNIIKYYESFVHNDKFIIVMEYASKGLKIIHKGDLQVYLKSYKQQTQFIKEKQIMIYLNQLICALTYLHEKKIIHRDIKLQNIFLTSDQQIKLGDFGISKQLDNSNQLAQTSLGTPYYLSPEICKNSQYDHKNDMWMLGCVLYELAAKEKPFQGDSLNAIIYNIMNNDPKPIPNIYSNFLNKIIMSLLEKNPEKRLNVSQLKQMIDKQQNQSLDIHNLIKKFDLKISESPYHQDFMVQKDFQQNQNTPTTNESDVLKFKKKHISIVTQNLNNQDSRPESDKYALFKIDQEDANNRPKTFSFGKQLFNSQNPTSPQRQILFQEFLKKKLGDQKYHQILDLINKQKDPIAFINEDNTILINLLGSQNKDTIKCFKLLFFQPQTNENRKFNFQDQKF